MKLFSSQAEAVLDFYKRLKPDFDLPGGISIMNPFADKVARQLADSFYHKFYADAQKRIFIFGINPGRFGGGITGVPFTDPIRLEQKCGIENNLKKLPELSSLFVYDMIDAYGGTASFYGDFLITALSPLGFMKDGKNLNYYDDKSLLKASEPYMINCIKRQLKTIVTTQSVAFCLGEGENYRYFKKLNDEHQFFEKIIPLPHPRWIMQYRRKNVDVYAKLYVEKLKAVL